ncbi:DNA (cytosine-5)-methyltransferase 1 [Spiroplasma chinense]|uniref:Cytosine-specific methyltransferase n=1 Tax=Spiroplasma chinense TaxID=216932 RepID=A0A5B9Y7D4_9MOLU|nr:DNA (cytosine-5-)-methyltransferase [Spiroplasma chinense]QEH62012.1 DNA (cytosine-5)-methyltransferase 1 [Spiroplasma chinense]
MKKIRIFETFAGIGAQHKAFEILKRNNILDYEVVGTSEWDIWANISYNAIHHNNENIAKELADIEIEDFLKKFTHSNNSKEPINNKNLSRFSRHTREMLYSSYKNSKNQGSIVEINGQRLIDEIGEFDLLTYSFPCQDLSVAGSFHGFNQGMAKGSGTRSGLLWEVERLLKELNSINKLPKYLLLENVKNMISDKHKNDYIEWISFLNGIGFNTQTYILNSKDYGIPQSRERVYALSILRPKNITFEDTYFSVGKIVSNNKPKDISEILGRKKTMERVLKLNYEDKTIRDEALESIPNRTPSRERMYFENRVLFTLRKEKKESCENKFTKIYHKFKNGYFLNYCSTLTTKQDRNPNAGIIDLKNTKLENLKIEEKRKANYRFLTPREAYLMMGFENQDVDKIYKSGLIRREVKYRQAGNSIVVNVLLAIFNLIKEV